MGLTHINEQGYAKMVDVTFKDDTQRIGIAAGSIFMAPATLKEITEGKIKKGEVLSVAQVAGIMAAKRTYEIIPMCHSLLLTGADIHFECDEKNSAIHITAIIKTTGKTGVEMEALTAVSAAALTIYDMCKSIDKDMIIQNIRLIEKSGGKSGHYQRGND